MKAQISGIKSDRDHGSGSVKPDPRIDSGAGSYSVYEGES